MAITTHGFRRASLLFVLVGLVLLCVGSTPQDLHAQAQSTQANPGGATLPPYSRVILGRIPFSSSTTKPEVSKSGAGLTIVPTFDAGIDVTSQGVINSAITFYEKTFTNNITVHIFFF